MCIPIAFKMPKFFTITEYVPNLLSPFAPVSAGLFTNSSRRLYILWKFPIVSIPFRFVLDRCNAILYFTFLRCNHFNWPAYLLSHYFALVFSFFALLCRSVILQCTLYLLDCCAFFSNPMCMHPWKKRILLCIFSFPFVIFLHLQPYKKLCFDLLFLCFFFASYFICWPASTSRQCRRIYFISVRFAIALTYIARILHFLVCFLACAFSEPHMYIIVNNWITIHMYIYRYCINC